MKLFVKKNSIFSPKIGKNNPIGRVFANWMIVYFGQFFENFRTNNSLCTATFFPGKSYPVHNIIKNGLGYV
jgi:hypothetical protein